MLNIIKKIKNTKPWSKAPDPTQGKQCMKGNCKCGKGYCAKYAWCLNNNCYCTTELPFMHDDLYVKSGDYGAFGCEVQSNNGHSSVGFFCEDGSYAEEDEDELKCITGYGEIIEYGGSTSNKQLEKMVGDSELLELCGRKSAELFQRDFSTFERFARELSKRELPETCKDGEEPWGEGDESLYEECLTVSRLEPERCEIRQACDAWYIPRQYRDQYVCEFEVGVWDGDLHSLSYYYPKAKGLRCVADTGCRCTHVKIDKGEYCNGIPEYGYPIDSEPEASSTDSKVVHKTFVDKSGLTWNEVRDTFQKPLYHGKWNNDSVAFAKVLGKSLSAWYESPHSHGDCTVSRINISDKLSVELMQCEVLYDDAVDGQVSCDAEGQNGYPIDLFLGIHNRETETMDVHWLGEKYTYCGDEIFFDNDYEYSLKYAYTEPLGDTQAVHAIVTEFRNHNDCKHDRVTGGIDCRTESIRGNDMHYVIAGDDFRLMGYYPERLLFKEVNGCGLEACGELLEANLYHGSLTLTSKEWQFVAKLWEMELHFSTDAEREKADVADRKGEYYIPKVISQYKKYLKYAKTDLAFEEAELHKFLKPQPDVIKRAEMRQGMFKLTARGGGTDPFWIER